MSFFCGPLGQAGRRDGGLSYTFYLFCLLLKLRSPIWIIKLFCLYAFILPTVLPLPWKISNLRPILSWSSLVIPHRCQTIWKKTSFLFQPGKLNTREGWLGTVDLLQCSSVTGLLNESNSLSAAFGVTKFVAVFATNLVTLRCSTTDTYLIVNFRHLCFNKQALAEVGLLNAQMWLK